MITVPKNILFISHDTSRTGAPIVFLNLLKWLKNNTDFYITILLKEEGELKDGFRVVSEPIHWNIRIRSRFYSKKLHHRVRRRLFGRTPRMSLPKRLQNQKFDLIYANTVVSAEEAVYLKSIYNCPIICHVHEMEYTINYYYPNALPVVTLSSIDHFIAVSKSTRENLIRNFRVDASKISICYEFVPIQEIKQPLKSKEEVRKELGLTDEFIVGGSGLTSWRKGVDLFVLLAHELNKIDPDNSIKLVWVGFTDYHFKCSYEYEQHRLHTAGKIIFTGQQAHPQNYFQVFDLFALTSREDPFPLVCLEAAALGKPILCFEQSGGMTEFVASEKEMIIPYADVHAMALKILQLQKDEDTLLRIGNEMKTMVEAYDVNRIAPEIVQVIEQTIKENA